MVSEVFTDLSTHGKTSSDVLWRVLVILVLRAKQVVLAFLANQYSPHGLSRLVREHVTKNKVDGT